LGKGLGEESSKRFSKGLGKALGEALGKRLSERFGQGLDERFGSGLGEELSQQLGKDLGKWFRSGFSGGLGEELGKGFGEGLSKDFGQGFGRDSRLSTCRTGCEAAGQSRPCVSLRAVMRVRARLGTGEREQGAVSREESAAGRKFRHRIQAPEGLTRLNH
jgi:hypothetical protein